MPLVFQNHFTALAEACQTILQHKPEGETYNTQPDPSFSCACESFSFFFLQPDGNECDRQTMEMKNGKSAGSAAPDPQGVTNV